MKRKGKYITTNMLLACLSKSSIIKKDIHAQLEETIAQRRRLIEQWENLVRATPSEIRQDIHAQLKKTIAGLRREMQQSRKSSSTEKQSVAMQDKKAA